MKNISAIFSILLSCALSTSVHATLINGGFETGDTTGWVEGPTYNGSVTNTIAHSGTYSLALEGIDGISQSFSSEAIFGDLSLWVRASNLIFTGPTMVTATYSDTTTASMTIGGASLSDTSWTKFTLALDTSKFLDEITIFTGETGTLYFDDISLPSNNGTGVPEPGVLALLSLGLFGIGIARKRS